MSYARAVQVWRILAHVLAGIYVLAALVGLFADFDRTRDTVLWVAFLGGGAFLILLGHRLARDSAWLAAIMVSVGAAAGGLPLFWSILVPLAAAIVIALSISIARQASATA